LRPRFLKVERSQFRKCRSVEKLKQHNDFGAARKIATTEIVARLQIWPRTTDD